jgi:hypothetical protein
MGSSSGSASGGNEVSAGNQEDTGRAITHQNPYTVGKKSKKKLKVVASVSPSIAAKPQPKNTKKLAYKRD